MSLAAGCYYDSKVPDYQGTIDYMRKVPHVYSALKELCISVPDENQILCERIQKVAVEPQKKKDWLKGLGDYPDQPTKVPLPGIDE
jgi:hypothetical protein